MALYITREDVRIRLIGKVRFTDDEDDENKFPYILLDRMINEAEGDVEQDLSPRYAAPFVTDADLPFKNLPARPTREYLRTMCELKAVLRVIETDFGVGTVVDAEKYSKSISDRYAAMLGKLMDKKKHGNEESGWKYPPLPGLKLNYMNTMADDGFAGSVLVAGSGNGGFPAERINNPAESFFSATLEDSY